MAETFLTAYDPSDLPGTSIDPLGFERGYLLLADKILPGLTNVASHPRYFALICAGIYLAGDAAELPQRELVEKRQKTVLRLERFWALANVLARPESSNAVRGVTYAQARIGELLRSGAARTSADYPLLSRQSQYGAIGIYANVADGMRFLNRSDLTLTPALGEPAAEAFLEETELPVSLRRAILDDSDIPVGTLRAWGERAHVEADTKLGEAKCLYEALHINPIRSRMTEILDRNRLRNEQEPELDRLSRIRHKLNGREQNRDLREAIACILDFESCYRLLNLAFERILWLCRHHAAASVNFADLKSDHVLKSVLERFPESGRRLLRSIRDATEPAFRAGIETLSDVAALVEAEINATTIEVFVRGLIQRHTEVQHGKFDKGRRKMGWVETNGQRLNLTITRVGGIKWEATQPEHIEPHPYRTAAADALMNASATAQS